MKNLFKLVVSIVVSELAGVIGAFFTTPAVRSDWYVELVKPALNPPAWVFGPVWTILYALMGIAAFLVWKQHSNILQNVGMLRVWRWAVSLFFVQLTLNILWSIIFFGLHSPGGALIEIIFLWLAILATIIAFAKISPPSAGVWTMDGHGKPAVHPVRAFIVSNGAWLLLVPYILWVSFAGYLNYSIWTLNHRVANVGQELVRVEMPWPHQTVRSPLVITGEARGDWFFEASFPVELLDGDNQILARGAARALGDWMTTEFVPFKATLPFIPGESPASRNGFIVLKKDNPSGIPANDASVSVPVVLGGSPWQISASYIYPVDWPPKLEVRGEPFSCGKPRAIAGRAYCVTEASEGAAGSTYVRYGYFSAHGSQTVVLTFVLRFAQCANYDDPQKTACENERSSFDIDGTVDRMARSIKSQ